MKKNLSVEGIDVKMGVEPTGNPIKQQPFHILLVGDFQNEGQNSKWDQPIEIDRDNFDQVFREFDPRWSGEVGPHSEPLHVEFESLEDFHPDSLYSKLDVFLQLRELRKKLKNDDTFLQAAQIVDGWSIAPTIKKDEGSQLQKDADDRPVNDEPPNADSGSLLDQIFEATEQATQTPTQDPISKLIQETAAPYAKPAPDSRKPDLIKSVDERTSETILGILHDPMFQRLEARWRAVKMLTKRLETDSNLKLFLWNVKPESILAEVAQDDELTETSAYRTLVEQTVETPGGVPWSVIAVDLYVGKSDEEIVAVGRLAKVAGRRQGRASGWN